MRRVLEARHQDDELVAPEARDRIRLTNKSAHPFGEHSEEFVSGRVAEHFVHAPEAVQTEHQNRKLLICPARRASICANWSQKSSWLGIRVNASREAPSPDPLAM